MKKDSRVAVLGLDGLSWSYFNKLVSKGDIPFIENLLNEAYKSVLYAFPPSTPPSWSSILTGVNPGKHGIFDFMYINLETYEQKLYTALDLEHPRIHEMLAFEKTPSIMVNPIPDYPIIPVKGVNVVSHLFFTPKVTYYPESMGKYAKLLEGHKIEIYYDVTYLDHLCNILDSYMVFLEETIDRFPWRLYWLTLNVPDTMLHKFPALLQERANRELVEGESRVFKRVNEIARKLYENTDHLIIVSDHGFRIYDYVVSVNDVLYEHGYIRLGKGREIKRHDELVMGMHGFKDPITRVKLPKPLVKIIAHRRMGIVRKTIKKIYKALTGKGLALGARIDPVLSKAFSPSHYSYGVIVKDEKIIPEVAKILKSHDGIADVKLREEVFKGPYVHRAPHLIVYPEYDKGVVLTGNGVFGLTLFKSKVPTHHPEGVLVYKPKCRQIKPLDWPERVENHIVTPLAMYLLGLPLPVDSDSINTIKKAFNESSVKVKNYTIYWKIAKRLQRVKTPRQ